MTAIPLAERKNFVGASEVAALFGLHPYKSRLALYLEKRGDVEPSGGDSEPAMLGRKLEAGIAGAAEEKWNDLYLTKSVGYLTHNTVRKFGASLDFEQPMADINGKIILTDGGYQIKCPVEIKHSAFGKGWTFSGDEITDCPEYILLQIQAQLAITEAPYAWLIVLSGRLYRVKIEANREAQERIEQAVVQFWHDVRDGKQPPANGDAETLAKIMPPSIKGKSVDLTGSNVATDAVNIYQHARISIMDYEIAKDRAKTDLLEAMGDAEIATLPGFRITHTTVNMKAYTKDMPAKYYPKFTVKEV